MYLASWQLLQLLRVAAVAAVAAVAGESKASFAFSDCASAFLLTSGRFSLLLKFPLSTYF